MGVLKFTLLVLALLLSAMPLLADEPIESARGIPVHFEYGIGISETAIEVAANVVREKGCPVTVSKDGLPKTVEVSTNRKSYMFEIPLNAASWAINHCLQNDIGE